MPARTIEIDAVDHTAAVRLDSLILVESALGGEVGQGGFLRDDSALAEVPAMKTATVEDAAASPNLIFDGFTGYRSLDRGALARVENLRQFDVTLLDLNTVLDDEVFSGSGANRPEETDYARVTWLLTTGAIAALSITAGVVPNTNTVTMDAADYRGAGPRRVLDECAEASKKNYFVYNYGSGRLLYYDLAVGTSLTSSAKLSSVLADVDFSTVWPFDGTPKLELDPSRVYSSVRYEYDGGHVTETDAAIEALYRRREITITDTAVKSAAKATNRALAYLDSVRNELRTFRASVSLPAANVNDIRAGQRIQVKAPHLTTDAIDLDDWVWMRISRREVQPQGGGSFDRYTLALEFAEDLRPLRFGGANDPSDSEGSTDDGAAVSLTRYQLISEIGSGYFGPAAGSLWTSVAPSFAFGASSAPVSSIVSRTPEGNIPYPYTDCGVGTGGVAGRTTREAWYRFTVDLADDTLIGVKVTVGAFLSSGSGYTLSPGGFLAGAGTVKVGVHTGASSIGAELTTEGEFTEVGVVGSGGGEAFIPRSLLLDNGSGYCWIVLAPNWETSGGIFICNSAGNKPWGYGDAGDTDASPTIIVSAVEVNVAGSGRSQWLPVDGDVDGSNDTYTLPNWDGTGTPEVRVGAVVLSAGEYTFDSGALTVTILEPPPAIMAGQVAARYNLG